MVAIFNIDKMSGRISSPYETLDKYLSQSPNESSSISCQIQRNTRRGEKVR